MQASGPLDERETVLVWNDGDETASMWTASASVCARMIKLGWAVVEEGERHAVFNFPKNRIKFPRQLSKRGFASRKGGTKCTT